MGPSSQGEQVVFACVISVGGDFNEEQAMNSLNSCCRVNPQLKGLDLPFKPKAASAQACLQSTQKQSTYPESAGSIMSLKAAGCGTKLQSNLNGQKTLADANHHARKQKGSFVSKRPLTCVGFYQVPKRGEPVVLMLCEGTGNTGEGSICNLISHKHFAVQKGP